MKAVVITRPGGPEMLEWQDVPDPTPGPGEALIEVAATAVNRADILQRQGHYDPQPGTSPYPGLEVSGRIAALGPDTDEAGWSVGDEVCALLSGGGYAERVTAPIGQLLAIPAGVGTVEAAALPEVTCTVWSNVFMLAGLRPGETLLVHGGGSGVGTMAIQLARHAGAAVVATAGSADKVARCVELGATVGVNYRDEDFVAAVRSATDGRGADVILDIIGAAYLARNLDALATNGRLVVIGLQRGTRAELDLGRLLAKRAALLATTLRFRPPEEKAAIVASVRQNVWPLVSDGHVRPVVDRVLPLSEPDRAHREFETGTHVGKVLLAAPAYDGARP